MKEPTYDWARLQVVKGQPRSVSQVKQYLPELGGCPYKYFLSRVVQAWSRPAAWLPQGLAVHEAAEQWELSGRTMSLKAMENIYRASYENHTRRLLKAAANADSWFSSGPYKGTADINRRLEKGLAQVRRYHDYYVNQRPGDVIWVTPNGEMAVELGFSVMFGSVLVRGFIDQILTEMMQDIKTGKQPGDTFQLSVYRYAILEEYGVDFTTGVYWMGEKGKPTKPYDLTAMTREQVTELFEKMDTGVKAESFEPNPGDQCERCDVRNACRYAI